MVFELRTLNRSLQEKALSLGEDGVLDSAHTQPLSLLSEIQQSQVLTNASWVLTGVLDLKTSALMTSFTCSGVGVSPLTSKVICLVLFFS